MSTIVRYFSASEVLRTSEKIEAYLQTFDFQQQCDERKISQELAAEMLCTSQASISRWQRKKRSMPPVLVLYWQLYWEVMDKRRTHRDKLKDAERVRRAKKKLESEQRGDSL